MPRRTLLEQPYTPPVAHTPELDAAEQNLTPGSSDLGLDDRLPALDDVNAALLGGSRGPRAHRSHRRRGRWTPSRWSRSGVQSRFVRVAGVKLPWPLVGLLAVPVVILLIVALRRMRRSYDQHHPALLSNGTHWFQPTTLLLSIDGLRHSYLDSHEAETPNLRALARDGVSGSMQPCFPSLTFPNHWSMLTGLYPGSHGIVANEFWDDVRQEEFDYANENSWAPRWWGGEPMWSVVQRAGRRAANVMWPGPPVTSDGVALHHFVPYKRVAPEHKLPLVNHYFDQPPNTAPSLILAYLPDVDQAGHAAGPESARVTSALAAVDAFVGALIADIETRNMSHIVDLVVVSDHGMAQLSSSRLMFLDDMLGVELYAEIAHRDGWPGFGLWFDDGVDFSQHVAVLQEGKNASYSVYTEENMPERWGFKGPRVAPVYVVPDLGWVITDHEEYSTHNGLSVLGAHGYDNTFPEMQAVFFARGPAAERMKQSAAESSEGWKTTAPAVLESFANLNIFNLVLKLQGVEEYAPPNNGTRGMWDKLF